MKQVKIEGAVALVTGANRSIGRALSEVAAMVAAMAAGSAA